MNSVHLALQGLTRRWFELAAEEGKTPTVEFDPKFLSPCIEPVSNTNSGEFIEWHPIPRHCENFFNDMEAALETRFHPDFIAWYTGFWSRDIPVLFEGRQYQLIQIWNEEDQGNLQQNVLGHAFAKSRNKLPLTLFIGCNDQDDVLCIDNASGEVVAEKPGFEPYTVLAPDLVSFLNKAVPDLSSAA